MDMKRKQFTYLKLLLLIVSFIGVLGACNSPGNDDDDDDDSADPINVTVKEGVFLDSAVQGISYVSGNQSGVTDANGTFLYDEGASVRFSIGGILLGESSSQGVITPIDLVDGATDATDTTVTNIAQFLQTLDSDGDANNGITIPANIATAAEGQTLDFTATDFDSTAASVLSDIGVSASLVSESTAQTHLQGTLAGVALGDTSGNLCRNPISIRGVDENGNLASNITTEYDSSGNPVRIVEQYFDEGVMDEELTATLEYDSSGNLIKEVEVSQLVEEGETLQEQSTKSYEYDSNGLLTKITFEEGEILAEGAQPEGIVESCEAAGPNGGDLLKEGVKIFLIGTETFEYDDAGTLIKSTSSGVRSCNIANVVEVCTYDYNSNGRVSRNECNETTTQIASGAVSTSQELATFEYDENGFLTKKTKTESETENGETLSESYFETFEYNSIGAITRSTEVDEGNFTVTSEWTYPDACPTE